MTSTQIEMAEPAPPPPPPPPPPPVLIPVVAPAPWRAQLLRDFADARTRLALFRTCRQLRDDVLQSAARVSATPPCNLVAALTSAATLLIQRGDQPTKVMIAPRSRDSAASELPQAFTALAPLAALPSLNQLQLECRFSQVPTQYQTYCILHLVSTLPTLADLSLSALAASLPVPDQLPHLRSLSVAVADMHTLDESRGVVGSISPYLTQLTQLTVTNCTHGQLQRALCGHTTSSLTTLTTSCDLSDDLLEALAKHTPALQQLACGALIFSCDQSHTTWGLQHLHITERVALRQISRLPRSVRPPLGVHWSPSTNHAHIAVSLPEDELCSVFSRAATDFTFHNLASVDVDMYETHLDEGDEVILAPLDVFQQRLLGLLGYLSTLQVVQDTPWGVRLKEWLWDRDRVQTLAAAVPEHPALCIRVRDDLTDTLLDLLLTHGPRGGYEFETRWIQSDRFAEVEWPWDRLVLDNHRARPARVISLLTRGGHKTRRVLLTGGRIDLQVDHASQMKSVLDQVPQQTEVVCDCGLVLVDLCHNSASPVEDLRAYLQVLNALQWSATSKQHKVTMDMQQTYWSLTPEVVAELAQLPPWGNELKVPSLTWEGHADVVGLFQQLSATVPACYHTWCLDTWSSSEEGGPELMAACEAVAAHRAEEGLPPVTVQLNVAERRHTGWAEVAENIRGSWVSKHVHMQLVFRTLGLYR